MINQNSIRLKLTFEPANKEHVQEVLNLFRHTSVQLKKKGLTQWSYWTDPPEEKIKWVRDGFEKGEFHFVYNERMEWVGIFRLLETDTLYWDHKGLEENVRYVHSLVLQPGNSGKGIGAQVLNQLASDLETLGVHKLRLDCDASNSRLTSYYEQQGFVKVGEKKTPFSVNNLYERILYLGPMKESNKSYTAKELSELLGGQLIGDSSHVIIGPEQIEMAGSNHITFIGNQKYVPLWQTSKASVAVIDKNLDIQEPGENRAFIKVNNADLAMAELLELFRPAQVDLEPGVHPTAFVHESSKIGQNVTIGPNAYIGKGASIGDNTVIFPNVSVLDDVVIGAHCQIRSGSVISERCTLGDHCLIQSNVSIGSDGFGYRPSPDGRGIVKIVHIGNVVIGNHVEIGSSTCIDRGKFSSTVIGDGTKIDNLVQIGHNCKIGRSCMIAGCCGISGSVTLGDGVIMAGQVAVKDHVTIGNGVTVGGKSGIINDIPDGQTILGFPAVPAKETLKQWAILKRMVRGKA